MFLGHFAVAFAVRGANPRARHATLSLGLLFFACQLADLVWPVLVLAGVERVAIDPTATVVTPLDFQSYPYSHSLLALLGWGVLVAIGHALWRRGGDRVRTGVLLAAVVLSHWLLDFLVHRPDLPLDPRGSARFGLGIWNSLPATLALEGLLLAFGVWLYARATRPLRRAGTIVLGALVAFLVLVYLASVFGPPAPSADAVAWTALSMWLLVAWGFWVDRLREDRVRDSTRGV